MVFCRAITRTETVCVCVFAGPNARSIQIYKQDETGGRISNMLTMMVEQEPGILQKGKKSVNDRDGSAQ